MCVVDSVSSTGLRACGGPASLYMRPTGGGSAKNSAMDISRRFYFFITDGMSKFSNFEAKASFASEVFTKRKREIFEISRREEDFEESFPKMPGFAPGVELSALLNSRN